METSVATTKTPGLGKTKRQMTDRAKLIIQSLIMGNTETQALKDAGYSDSCATFRKTDILQNPHMQQTFRDTLERAGVTDNFLADKIRGLIDAKETKFFSHQGKVVDQKEVQALGIQADMVQFAAKLKGHLVGSEPQAQGNTYVDLSTYQIAVKVESGAGLPVDNCANAGDQEGKGC